MFTPRRVCPVCGHPAARYHFRNDVQTGKARLVCGACADAPRFPAVPPSHPTRLMAVAPLVSYARPASPTVPLPQVYDPGATGPLVEVPARWAPTMTALSGGRRGR
jgi:hypothetical protein